MLYEAKVSHVENRGSPDTAWLTLQVPFTASGQTYTGQLVLAVSRAAWESEGLPDGKDVAWPPAVGDRFRVAVELVARGG